MSSSKITVYNERLKVEGMNARRHIKDNLANLEDADALAIIESFRTIEYDLDSIPMTRVQRDEIDHKLKTIGLLFTDSK